MMVLQNHSETGTRNFEESGRTRIKLILQIGTFRLRTDRSGRSVLTNGKYPNIAEIQADRRHTSCLDTCRYDVVSLRKTSPPKKHCSKTCSSQDVKQFVSSALWNLRVFFAPHDVTFDSLLVVDSIQDGPQLTLLR